MQAHTRGKVGTTELSIAHFMGAGGAAKFLNAHSQDGNRTAAQDFPQEAKHNKGVFYDADGNPRTYNQIYRFFSHKFTGGTAAVSAAADAQQAVPAKASATPAQSGNLMHTLNHVIGAQALSSFDDSNGSQVVWHAPRSRHHSNATSGFGHQKSPMQKLDVSSVLTIAEMTHARASGSASTTASTAPRNVNWHN